VPPRKREANEVGIIAEPLFSDEQLRHFMQGIALFNAGKHWHAHEEWEATWLPMGDGPEDDGEIFLRALIQVASGMHLKRIGRYGGARHHFEKALPKLHCLPPRFLGLDVSAIRLYAELQLREFSREYVFRLRRY